MTGWVVAIPYAFGAAVMIPWARHSDYTGERVWHVALPVFLGGASLISLAHIGDARFAIVALTLAAIGVHAALPTFWALPTALFTGTAAAAVIAFVTAVGNLGGFAGPYLVGWMLRLFKDPALATASLGGFMAVSGIMILGFGAQQADGGPLRCLEIFRF